MNAHLHTHSRSNPLHEEGCLSSKVGFRFHPTDEEIVAYYLENKINGNDSLVNHIIGEIDLCQYEPRDLPDHSLISSDDKIWYFFSRPDFKYSNGKRANRTTRAGFWKATGKIRYIKAGESRKEIGSKRTLVFHKKVHDSKPVRTNWIIHEYQSKNILPNQRHFVLCKLKQKVDENIDHSPEDEGEPSRPTDAQTDPEQVLQSQICIMGMHPEGLKQQGVSDEHLLQTNCFDNPHMGLDLHDTSDDEDPIKLADSFLSLDDECFTQKNADVPPNDYRPPEPLRKTYVADIHWKTASGYSESPQPTKTSNLNDGDASSEEYQQMQTVLTPTETLTSGEGKNDPYRKEVSVTGTSTAGSAADRPFEINYIRYAYKPGVCRGIASFSSVVTRDKSFEDMENCLSGQGQDRCYCLPEINRNESVGEEFPKPQKRLMISNFTGQKLNPSTVSTGEVTNLSCSYITSKEPEKPGLNLKSTRSSDNDREVCSIRSEITPLIHRPNPPSVYIVNILVGLVLFIFIVREMLILH
ncbi:NAC domain-containing protein 62 [Hevea brasiliensis]|uniref:NAC domain-containing protein 62 n=1 Tax=Hevea brasiliensis TaxID=3981 RepID=UPI0025DC3CBC|nr:NAC domain-containing protein 62 [Hevea brasiliensis]XP_021676070.2 NAC domain-containing protein 62 [Hevea brasiliensis]